MYYQVRITSSMIPVPHNQLHAPHQVINTHNW